MAGILDLLNSDLGKQIISGVGQQVGTNEKETSSVLSSALPALLGAMKNNASTQQGADGLLGALTSGKHDGGLLDNLGGFLGGGDFSEGGKILGHVLGNNQNAVQNNLSQSTGVSSDKVGSILSMAAPIVMSYLSKQTSQNNISSGNDLGGLLGGLLGGGQASQSSSVGGSMLTSVLDQNGDGKLDLSDAVSVATKKGGIGGFLGSLFGKK
jgi:hypothetical protein